MSRGEDWFQILWYWSQHSPGKTENLLCCFIWNCYLSFFHLLEWYVLYSLNDKIMVSTSRNRQKDRRFFTELDEFPVNQFMEQDNHDSRTRRRTNTLGGNVVSGIRNRLMSVNGSQVVLIMNLKSYWQNA